MTFSQLMIPALGHEFIKRIAERFGWRFGVFGLVTLVMAVACTSSPASPIVPPSNTPPFLERPVPTASSTAERPAPTSAAATPDGNPANTAVPSREPVATPTDTPLPESTRAPEPTVEVEPTPGLTTTTGGSSTLSPAEADPEVIASIYRELNPDGPKDVEARFFDQLLPPDAIEPIYSPAIGLPDAAELEADELIIGVSLGGESRAYPIKVLRFREMVNDKLGGAPILVTW